MEVHITPSNCYELRIIKGENKYIGLLKLKVLNGTFMVIDFLIRDTTKQILNYCQDKYNINKESEILNIINESSIETKAS